MNIRKNFFLFMILIASFFLENCRSEFPLPVLLEAEILTTSNGDKILTSTDTNATVRIHGRALANIDTVGLCSTFNCGSPTAGSIILKTANYVDATLSGWSGAGTYYIVISRTEDYDGSPYTKTSNQIELRVN